MVMARKESTPEEQEGSGELAHTLYSGFLAPLERMVDHGLIGNRKKCFGVIVGASKGTQSRP